MAKKSLNMIIKWIKMYKKVIRKVKSGIFQLVHTNLKSHKIFAPLNDGETVTFRNSGCRGSHLKKKSDYVWIFSKQP